MDRQRRLFYLILSGILLCLALFTGAGQIFLARSDNPAVQAQIRLVLWSAAFISALFIAIVCYVLYLLVFRPLRMLSREVRIITSVNPGYLIGQSHPHLLGDIPKLIGELAEAHMRARREIAEAVSGSSVDLENSRARLETILTSLREGIIVCDEQARITFYNPAARRVFHDSTAIGLGRSLYQVLSPSPVDSSLAILRQRRVRHPEEPDAEKDISFVCSTLAGTIVRCTMRLLPVIPGLSWYVVFSCEDVSRETDAWSRRENLLRAAVKKMQTPLTSLCLSADSLELLTDLDADRRAALEHSLAEDARSLAGQFEVLTREIGNMESLRYLADDVFAGDVVACVARRLKEKGIVLTLIGDPLWVKTDINALLHLLEFLALKIHEYTNSMTLEAETLLGDRRVYVNLYWHGASIPETEIRRWKSDLLMPPSLHTVAEVLERLGSEIWSRPHDTPGFAFLRIPMPLSTQQWEPPLPVLPARPVYADVPVYEDSSAPPLLRDTPLDRVPFVVFDTETTGLAPREGDEIISIAAVKIINRGIVVGETFDRLVNPGRPIPASSVRFHGITDDMVADKPSIDEVLIAFHAFAGDAVLVGHNAAFDMRFVRMKERSAGIRFKGPVLDTLALSLYLHDHTPEHSLDAVARRLGVEIRARHTALGDSLITAQVFIKFLYLLQEKGITTLGQALEASQR